MAAVNIGMTESQRLQFREAVATFIQDYRSGVVRISRGHNATHLERKIEKKFKALVLDLDTSMASLLTWEQLTRYQAYRTLLLARLTDRGTVDPEHYLDWEVPVITHH